MILSDRGQTSLDGAGVGMEKPHSLTADDDEFEAYRKRMMLAYRFRPNPLVSSYTLLGNVNITTNTFHIFGKLKVWNIQT